MAQRPEATEPDMSVTIRIPKRLHRALKVFAVEHESSLKRVFVTALEKAVAKK